MKTKYTFFLIMLLPVFIIAGIHTYGALEASSPTVISPGGAHTCALLVNGHMKCWGRGSHGALGQGNTNNIGDGPDEMGDNLALINLGTSRTASAISSGRFQTCAILDNKGIKCWGKGSYGVLGQGNTNNVGDNPNEMGDSLPTIDLGQNVGSRFSIGEYHACAVLDDGNVKCWGLGTYGQLGQGNTNSLGDNPNEIGNNLAAIDLGGNRSVISITTGRFQSCAVLDTGNVKCWGSGAYGQLGQGNTNNIGDGPNEMGDKLLPIDLGTGKRAISVSSGHSHNCALFEDGTIKCWGNGANGRLGQGNTAHLGDDPNELGNYLHPVDLGTNKTALQVVLGWYHACALLNDHTVKCWGNGAYGQLGQGNINSLGDAPNEMGDSLNTVNLGTNKSAIEISAGETHSCALLNDDTVKCWGVGHHGRLGYGNSFSKGEGPGEMGDNLPTIDFGTNIMVTPTPTTIPPTPSPTPSPTPLPPITVIPNAKITPVVQSMDVLTSVKSVVIHPNSTNLISLESASMLLKIPKYSQEQSYQVRIDTDLKRCIARSSANGGQLLRCITIDLFDFQGNPQINTDLWKAASLEIDMNQSEISVAGGTVSAYIAAMSGEYKLQRYDPNRTGARWVDIHNLVSKSEDKITVKAGYLRRDFGTYRFVHYPGPISERTKSTSSIPITAVPITVPTLTPNPVATTTGWSPSFTATPIPSIIVDGSERITPTPTIVGGPPNPMAPLVGDTRVHIRWLVFTSLLGLTVITLGLGFISKNKKPTF